MRAYRCQKRQRRPDEDTGDLIAAGRAREIERLRALCASGAKGITGWRTQLRDAVHADLRATVGIVAGLPRWVTA